MLNKVSKSLFVCSLKNSLVSFHRYMHKLSKMQFGSTQLIVCWQSRTSMEVHRLKSHQPTRNSSHIAVFRLATAPSWSLTQTTGYQRHSCRTFMGSLHRGLWHPGTPRPSRHQRTKYGQPNKTQWTRMWTNAQRDGRPAEYRWRPLFNAAKFGWCPILECSAVTLPRRETRWN